MIGMALKGVGQKGFFDRPRVKNAMDKATGRVLSKFGAYTRTRVQTSLKYRKESSGAGQVPSVHRGKFTRTKVNKKTGVAKTQQVSPLRELIFFSFEPGMRPSVVIGPTLFNQSARAARAVGGTVPKVLEEGGTIELVGKKRRRKARVARHPFMLPAFEREKAESLPRLWRDSMRAA